jgi:hypothetical protein
MAGIRLNDAWYCSRGCVEAAAREGLDERAKPATTVAPLPPLKLGVLLRHVGAITEAQLDLAFAMQRTSGLRLGAQLQQLGFVGPDPILKALASQCQVSYLTSFDVARVQRGPGGLAAETVRALGVVPFDADHARRVLKVICTAPVPRTALRALEKLTGWTAEPYLVDDAVWELALDLYQPAQAAASGRTQVQRVGTVRDAAAQVAAAAARHRAVTMRHAECDDYMWVRVEGREQVTDFLIRGNEEKPCRVAHTAR